MFPTANPHVTVADAGVERQRLCVYTAAHTVACILDSAVGADYICFVVHVSKQTKNKPDLNRSSQPPNLPMLLPLILLFRQVKAWMPVHALHCRLSECRCNPRGPLRLIHVTSHAVAQGLPSVIWVVLCAPSCNRATLVCEHLYHTTASVTRHPQLSIRQHWTAIAHAETGDASRVCCLSTAVDASAADDSTQLLRTLCTGTYHVPADRSLRPYMVATAVTPVSQNEDGSCNIAVQASHGSSSAPDDSEPRRWRCVLT